MWDDPFATSQSTTIIYMCVGVMLLACRCIVAGLEGPWLVDTFCHVRVQKPIHRLVRSIVIKAWTKHASSFRGFRSTQQI